MSSRHPTHSRDTSPEALLVQLDALRRLGAAGRLDAAFDMSDELRRITAAGVRSRHPGYDDAAVQRAVARLWLGEELFRKACPAVEIRP